MGFNRHDPESLWTGQRVDLHGKLGTCQEWPAVNKGNLLIKTLSCCARTACMHWLAKWGGGMICSHSGHLRY